VSWVFGLENIAWDKAEDQVVCLVLDAGGRTQVFHEDIEIRAVCTEALGRFG